MLAVADGDRLAAERLARVGRVEDELDHLPVALVRVVPVVEDVEEPVLERELARIAGIGGDVGVDGRRRALAEAVAPSARSCSRGRARSPGSRGGTRRGCSRVAPRRGRPRSGHRSPTARGAPPSARRRGRRRRSARTTRRSRSPAPGRRAGRPGRSVRPARSRRRGRPTRGGVATSASTAMSR